MVSNMKDYLAILTNARKESGKTQYSFFIRSLIG